MNKKNEQEKIALIDEALLINVAGGDGESEDCGPGDCTNHGGCEDESEEEMR